MIRIYRSNMEVVALKVYDSVLDLVGRTPLIEVHNMEKEDNSEARILAKLEFFNPARSVKDRIAKDDHYCYHSGSSAKGRYCEP